MDKYRRLHTFSSKNSTTTNINNRKSIVSKINFMTLDTLCVCVC